MRRRVYYRLLTRTSFIGALAHRTHQILQLNQLDHFLCYGTLWGQIRYARLLPWATRAYLCVFDEQMAAIDPGVLWSGFQQEFLQLRHSAAEGSYTVQRNHHAHPQVELVAFGYDAEQDVYRRSGWRRRLLPPSCDWSPALDCFPANLVRGGPLPQRRLGRFEYAVPQAGIEIQKYNYEDNWWRAVHLRQEQCPLSVGQMIGE